jgi:hypothetical protein
MIFPHVPVFPRFQVDLLLSRDICRAWFPPSPIWHTCSIREIYIQRTHVNYRILAGSVGGLGYPAPRTAEEGDGNLQILGLGRLLLWA